MCVCLQDCQPLWPNKLYSVVFRSNVEMGCSLSFFVGVKTPRKPLAFGCFLFPHQQQHLPSWGVYGNWHGFLGSFLCKEVFIRLFRQILAAPFDLFFFLFSSPFPVNNRPPCSPSVFFFFGNHLIFALNVASHIIFQCFVLSRTRIWYDCCPGFVDEKSILLPLCKIFFKDIMLNICLQIFSRLIASPSKK